MVFCIFNYSFTLDNEDGYKTLIVRLRACERDHSKTCGWICKKNTVSG